MSASTLKNTRTNTSDTQIATILKREDMKNEQSIHKLLNAANYARIHGNTLETSERLKNLLRKAARTMPDVYLLVAAQRVLERTGASAEALEEQRKRRLSKFETMSIL